MQIIAHRGASHDAPENTLASAQLAWAQAADALEIDVRLTHDGRLAVIHDADTRRTSGVARMVANSTLEELRRLDVGAWKDTRFAGETIPALDDVLALVPTGKRVFVEIKGAPDAVGELERCISAAQRDRSLRPDQIAIISFELGVAQAAKRALPRHEVCWIVDSNTNTPYSTLEEIASVARTAGLDGINVEAGWALDASSVQQIRSGGFKLYVWTVDDPLLARHLAAVGVDGLTTNRPGWLRAQILAREQGRVS